MEDSGLRSSMLSLFCDDLPEFDGEGPEFPPLRQLTKLLSIEHIVTTSYRPRLNGNTERVHRWLNAAIAHFEKE